MKCHRTGMYIYECSFIVLFVVSGQGTMTKVLKGLKGEQVSHRVRQVHVNIH